MILLLLKICPTLIHHCLKYTKNIKLKEAVSSTPKWWDSVAHKEMLDV